MTKFIKVDTSKSLKYSENGRLSPASEQEKAAVKSTMYYCNLCAKAVSVTGSKVFGSDILCPICGSKCIYFE